MNPLPDKIKVSMGPYYWMVFYSSKEFTPMKPRDAKNRLEKNYEPESGHHHVENGHVVQNWVRKPSRPK